MGTYFIKILVIRLIRSANFSLESFSRNRSVMMGKEKDDEQQRVVSGHSNFRVSNLSIIQKVMALLMFFSLRVS